MSENLPLSLQTFIEHFDFQIFIETNRGDWKMPLEWHRSLEIFYVLDGVGTYLIEDRSYKFKKGDLFVIGNQELHKSQLIDGQSFKAIVVMFDPDLLKAVQVEDELEPLDLFYDRPAEFSHQLEVDQPLHDSIMYIFNQMIQEVERKEGYSSRGIVSLLQWLIIQLSRVYEETRGAKIIDRFSGVRMKNVITKLLDYINQHYSEDMNLEQVAHRFNVNPSYMSREFKKSTGFTIVEFITAKRIRLARNLLRTTNYSVTKISSKVGYNNVTHFNWTFKKIMGISPVQYRKMSKVYNR
jgi:AraC-like DNA-binding protein/mannose-6-phosphate isomerase-like protein (cupin superfamily)